MIRTCDGTDPNLTGADGNPCECGLVFDDVRYMVAFPHLYIPTHEEKDALIKAWTAMRDSITPVWAAIREDYKELIYGVSDTFAPFIVVDMSTPVPKFNTLDEAEGYFEAWDADPEKAAIYVRYRPGMEIK